MSQKKHDITRRNGSQHKILIGYILRYQLVISNWQHINIRQVPFVKLQANYDLPPSNCKCLTKYDNIPRRIWPIANCDWDIMDGCKYTVFGTPVVALCHETH